MAVNFSRRQFIKLSALFAGSVATIGAATNADWDKLLHPPVSDPAQLPTFRANAQTTGELIHPNGETMQMPISSAQPAIMAPNAPMPMGASAATATVGNHRWVMVIDLAKCDGCRGCTTACQSMHFVPPNQEWIKVFENRDNSVAGAYFFPRACMQCDNPPCAKVCPVGATIKREDGIVLVDQDRCIGCRYCIAACPYGARSFNWSEPPHTAAELAQPYSIERNYPHRRGVVEKCIFCPEMTRAGKIPACAAACNMDAIWFGDQVEDVVKNHSGEMVSFSQLIREKGGFRYMEELGTDPRVWYLPPRDRIYPAPKA